MVVAALIPAHAVRDYLSHRANGSITNKKTAGGIGLDGARSMSALPSALRSEQGLPGTGRDLPAGEIEPALRAEGLDETWSRAITSDFVAYPRSPEELASYVSSGLPEFDGQSQSAPISPEPTWFQRAVNRLLHPISWNLSASATLPRTTSFVLLSICLGAAAIRLALLFRSVRQMRRLKRVSAAPSVAFAERFRALCRELHMNRRVGLRISSVHRSPVLVGFVHPVILLPCDEARESRLAESEQILSHELAHVRRWDDWANLAQHLVQAAFFFHPAVWWVGKRLVFEREIACDDWVLQRGTRPRAYALLLAELAKRISRPSLVLAPGASTAKSQLQQRINMILNPRRNTSTRLAASRVGSFTTAAALAAALALYFAPRLVMALEQPADTVPDTPQAAEPDDETLVLAIPSPDAEWGEADAAIIPALAPPATPTLPRPAIIARQDFTPAPATPSVNELPDASAAPRPAQPRVLPRQPGPPEARFSEASIEERLARLEEMVHSLLAQRGAKFAPGDASAEWRDSENKARMGAKELERNRELIKRQNARAEEESARVRQAHERAFETEGDQREQARLREDLTLQMKALEEQRENLERQMHELRRQMEKLERNQDAVKKWYPDDARPEEPKAEPRPGE